MRKMMTRGSSVSVAARVGRRQLLARWCHRLGALPLLKRVRPGARGEARVLAYHRVLESAEPQDFSFDPELISASAEAFREQMRHLKAHFVPMRFDEVLDHQRRGVPLPAGAVLVTFDDGYDDNYRVAFPILRELGMSAMFFVSTGASTRAGRMRTTGWCTCCARSPRASACTCPSWTSTGASRRPCRNAGGRPPTCVPGEAAG